MGNGVAIYLGLKKSWDENLSFLARCKGKGVKRFFTSLQMPEADKIRLKEEFLCLGNWCKANGADLICDVSPKTLGIIGLKSFHDHEFSESGISTIRLDDGFSIEEIVELSQSSFRIQLNASTCSEEFLLDLSRAGANLDKIEALHNYYPKPYTGLNKDYFRGINYLLKRFKVKVAAFIPDYTEPRGPIFKGLPTLEEHRYMDPLFTHQHLKLLGVDNVFIGDEGLSDETLDILADKDLAVIKLPIKLAKNTSAEIAKIIKEYDFSVRGEITDYTWRTVESRNLFKNCTLPITSPWEAQKGDLMINNEKALRYKGELEIAKIDFNFGDTYNFVGKVDKNYLKLLDDLVGNRKIKFLLFDNLSFCDDNI